MRGCDLYSNFAEESGYTAPLFSLERAAERIESLSWVEFFEESRGYGSGS